MHSNDSDNLNELSRSNSPYLLQHANNPVAWRMWSEETLEEAKSRDIPLFISIGYSTCHWCHVMARESFEDEDVARLLNNGFMPVKIDREERPDLDAFYMDAALRIHGSGGWPLTIFATPEGRPFFTATYLPRKGGPGRAGLLDLLPEISRLWKEERPRVLSSAESILEALTGNTDESSSRSEDFPRTRLSGLFEQLSDTFDPEWGGFGGAPKFPQAHLLNFILEHAREIHGGEQYIAMVEKSLERMRAGGIFDHIGFGFHRYSTDRQWQVPHFEKMLYDQAQLILLFINARNLTGKTEYAKTAREIIEFCCRELASPEGGFYSALDAESEGEEGKYYLWSRREFIEILEKLVGEDEASATADRFSLREEGNWSDPVSGKSMESNILYCSPGSSDSEISSDWDDMRRALLSRRNQRRLPSMDDKILTDWNSMMLKAIARAARVLEDSSLLQKAFETEEFLRTRLRGNDGRVFHSYRAGTASVRGHLDDYALLISAYLELYRSSFDAQFLEQALSLSRIVDEDFLDSERGDYYLASREQREVPFRSKHLYDGAIPSGTSVMMDNLLLLFRITSDSGFRDRAEALLKAWADEIDRAPIASTSFVSAGHYLLLGQEGSGPREIVVVGDGKESEKMLREINGRCMPGAVVLKKDAANEKLLSRCAPFTREYHAIEETGAAAYVCSGFICRKPVSRVEELRRELDELPR
ncbi:thioredoxin domain-containing protein [Marispirochaeta aestuarii]|uniref:thioredoxin domain-containing protein n=1 Tax=Marispirochaeta aestuarii TaxID=1963862 RepID=UPI0029C75462|nr:thioredoxin domain-containing protein [Marispirochaeta aestuarii]